MANKQINQYPDLAAYTGAYKLLVDNGSGSYYSFTMSKVSPVEGSTSITTLGTIATGTWQGTAIADSYIASAATWNNLVSANPNLTSDDTDILSLSGQDFTFVSSNLAKLDENETVTGAYTFSNDSYFSQQVNVASGTGTGVRITGNQLIGYDGTAFNNMVLRAKSGSDQLVLNTDGSVSTSGILSLTNTTDATSTTTGSLITAGGLGVAKKLYVGEGVNVTNGNITISKTSGSSATLELSNTEGDWSVFTDAGAFYIRDITSASNKLKATSTTFDFFSNDINTTGNASFADGTSGQHGITYNQLHNASLTPDFAGVEINGASINTAGALSNVAYLNQVNNFNVASTTNPTNLFRNTSYSSTDASGESSLGLYFLNHGAAKIAAYKTSTNTTGIKLYGEYGFNAQRLLATFNANYNVEFYGNLTAAGTIQSTTGIFTNLTDNYVPISTASGLDDSPIAVSGSNVGIGTSSPIAQLNIDADGWAGSDAFMTFTDASNINWSIGSDDSVDGFVFSQGTSLSENPLITILENGRVGFGTTSPSEKLHVVGNGLFTGTGTFGGLISNINSDGGETFPIILRNTFSTSNTSVGLKFIPASVDSRFASIEAINDGSNNISLAFVTGSGASITEKLRINYQGWTGIGYTSVVSSEKLAVNGSAYINGSVTATSFINSTYNDATKTLQGDGSVIDLFDATEDISVNSVSIGGSAVGSAALYDAWTGTQAAYDALGTWDSNTLYIIIG